MDAMILWPLIGPALLYGGVLSALLSVLLLALLWMNPEILLSDTGRPMFGTTITARSDVDCVR